MGWPNNVPGASLWMDGRLFLLGWMKQSQVKEGLCKGRNLLHGMMRRRARRLTSWSMRAVAICMCATVASGAEPGKEVLKWHGHHIEHHSFNALVCAVARVGDVSGGNAEAYMTLHAATRRRLCVDGRLEKALGWGRVRVVDRTGSGFMGAIRGVPARAVRCWILELTEIPVASAWPRYIAVSSDGKDEVLLDQYPSLNMRVAAEGFVSGVLRRWSGRFFEVEGDGNGGRTLRTPTGSHPRELERESAVAVSSEEGSRADGWSAPSVVTVSNLEWTAEVVKIRVPIQNSAARPVEIVAVKGSCSCLKTTNFKGAIGPGESREIELEFERAKLKGGMAFEVAVVIEGRQGALSHRYVRVRGSFAAGSVVFLDPPRASLVPGWTKAELEVFCSERMARHVKVLGVEDLRPGIEAKFVGHEPMEAPIGRFMSIGTLIVSNSHGSADSGSAGDAVGTINLEVEGGRIVTMQY